MIFIWFFISPSTCSLRAMVEAPARTAGTGRQALARTRSAVTMRTFAEGMPGRFPESTGLIPSISRARNPWRRRLRWRLSRVPLLTITWRMSATIQWFKSTSPNRSLRSLRALIHFRSTRSSQAFDCGFLLKKTPSSYVFDLLLSLSKAYFHFPTSTRTLLFGAFNSLLHVIHLLQVPFVHSSLRDIWAVSNFSLMYIHCFYSSLFTWVSVKFSSCLYLML